MTEIIAKTRECGDCSMCCKLPGIDHPEIGKPAGKWCSKWDKNTQCAIYLNRPSLCREFNCLFVLHYNLPEKLRPSKCGVVMAMYKENVLIVYVENHRKDAWREGEIGNFLRGWPEKFIVECRGVKRWVDPSGGG